ncbi:MAG: phosphatase PAP2 family protein [Acidimicrobiia bacterium]|nr:phosphatase PAP2 family protein [Acidimicrobiia bacterium]
MSRRTPGSAARYVGALAVLAWSARRARSGDVSPQEEWLFRALNTAPDDFGLGVWTVMQSGSFGAVPVVAALTAAQRGRRQGGVVAVAGTTAWLTGKVCKSLVERGRPSDLLPGVVVRGKPQSGLGYPSGHAAVALTLALTAARAGSPRVFAVGVAGVAAAGRVYTGAHLPLDVIGGLGLGAIVGGLAGGDHSAPG